MSVEIEKSWKKVLDEEFKKSYFSKLSKKIHQAYRATTVYPPAPQIFNAFNRCPFTKVKVVILGQDPYFGPGQAHGLSFSVSSSSETPPSLKNIKKEILSDIGAIHIENGDLSDWAKQGVLLLNSTLTVEAGKPASHRGLGWENFTDAVIKKISDHKEHVVFLLWGKHATEKRVLIDEGKHLVLTAPHPSPLSAYRGFFGCKHFSKTNAYLKTTGQTSIDW